jgi:hypothetical protein
VHVPARCLCELPRLESCIAPSSVFLNSRKKKGASQKSVPKKRTLSARRKSSIARKNCYRCQSPVVPEPEPVIDETSLAQHRATLVRDQDGWLLRYPLQGRSFYDERAFQPPDRNHGSTWRGFAPDGGAFAARPQPAQEIPAEPAEVQQTPPPSLPCNAALILRLPEGGGEIVALRIRGKGNFLLTKSQ